jgi:hypothetical protein
MKGLEMTKRTIHCDLDVVEGLMVGTATALFIAALIIAGCSIAANAQDKPPVDEQTKICALKRAYELNGNSMVGNGYSIDVGKEDLSKCLNPPQAAAQPQKKAKGN